MAFALRLREQQEPYHHHHHHHHQELATDVSFSLTRWQHLEKLAREEEEAEEEGEE